MIYIKTMLKNSNQEALLHNRRLLEKLDSVSYWRIFTHSLQQKTWYKNSQFNSLDAYFTCTHSGRRYKQELTRIKHYFENLAEPLPSMVRFFNSIVEHTHRMAKKLDTSAKRKTWLGRGWGESVNTESNLELKLSLQPHLLCPGGRLRNFVKL